MVYITSWDEFVDRSVQLFRNDPDSTRYVMKYRHCDGKLVLKVTDNKEEPNTEFNFPLQGSKLVPYYFYCHDLTFWVSDFAIPVVMVMPLLLFCFDQCLKFKTDQAQDAKKMEKLNNIFFTLMSRGPDADVSEVTGKEQMDAQPGKKGRGRKQ